MKILALYPGLNPAFDEVAYALPPLIAHGCQVRVITSQVSALKSSELGNTFEDFGGVEIYRSYADPWKMIALDPASTAEVQRLVAEFQPDLFLVNSPHCLPLLRLLRRHHWLPAVLRLESADPLTLVRRRNYLGFPPLGRLVGRGYWNRYAREVEAIMVNDPPDLHHLVRLGRPDCPVYYAAHCAQQPAGVALAASRDMGQMIYIGSLIRHKNCDAWLRNVPVILEQTPTERFTVIGRGPFQHVLDTLKQRYGARIEHITGVTRVEALQRLSGAGFAYTEATTGWGFLCDAWSTNTPVLCPQSTFGVVPGWTGMMPQTPAALAKTVRRLYDDPDYYQTLQQGGATRYQSEHVAEVVARQYLQILREVAAAGGRAA